MQPSAPRDGRPCPLPRWFPVAVGIFSAVSLGSGSAQARPPRSERVINRIAERAYARASIAEARAARAEARVAEIAPLAPVPPPPHPATVRRMRRAGVPLAGPLPLFPQPAPQLGRVAPPVVATSPARTLPSNQPATAVAAGQLAVTPSPRPAGSSIAPPQPAPAGARGEPGADGTQSVLASAEETAPEAAARPAAGLEIAEPPIELLPTPQPE